MSQNSGAGARLPPPTASGNRLAVIASHLSGPPLGSPAAMSGEKEAALATEPSGSPTIVDKIIRKEIPSQVVYEDEKVLAFRDISPQAPTHIIIIAKVKDGLSGLSKAEERHVEVLGGLLYAVKVVAKQEGLDDGFRVVINDGPKGCEYRSLVLTGPILSVAWWGMGIRLIFLSSAITYVNRCTTYTFIFWGDGR